MIWCNNRLHCSRQTKAMHCYITLSVSATNFQQRNLFKGAACFLESKGIQSDSRQASVPMRAKGFRVFQASIGAYAAFFLKSKGIQSDSRQAASVPMLLSEEDIPDPAVQARMSPFGSCDCPPFKKIYIIFLAQPLKLEVKCYDLLLLYNINRAVYWACAGWKSSV